MLLYTPPGSVPKMAAAKAATSRDPPAMQRNPQITKRILQDQAALVLAKAACTKEPEEAIAVLTPPPMHGMTLYIPPHKSSSEQSSLKRKALGDSRIEQESNLVAKAACIKEPEETTDVPPRHEMTLAEARNDPLHPSSEIPSLKRKALDHIGKLDRDSRIEQESEPKEAAVAWTPPIAMAESTKGTESAKSTKRGKLDRDSRIEQQSEPKEAVVAWTPPIAITKSTKSAKSTRSTKNEEKTVSGKTKMKPTHKKPPPLRKKSTNKTTHSNGEKKPSPSDDSGFWSLREEQK
jgi:hypothetical protein